MSKNFYFYRTLITATYTGYGFAKEINEFMLIDQSSQKSLFVETYNNKRVLITGHTGFKGAWLSIWLNSIGADVIGFSQVPPTNPSLFAASGIESKINHIIGDIREYQKLIEVIDHFKPEFVFHLAAQAIVRESYSSPKLTMDTNVGGTVNILEAVRNTSSVKSFVNVTSDKCYDNREWVWGYRENDPMGGNDPYSASKGCAELVFSSYLASFFSKEPIGVASVRAGNVVGGGDWAKDRLIPDCVRSFISNETIKVRNPNAIRPWQHVFEPLRGYLLLGALLSQQPHSYSGAWNFGPTAENTVRVDHLVESFISLWGSGDWFTGVSGDDRQKEAKALALCCDKANTFLGWHPVLSLNETLKLTVDWYKAYYGDRNVYSKSIEQLDYYMSKI